MLDLLRRSIVLERLTHVLLLPGLFAGLLLAQSEKGPRQIQFALKLLF
jgi:hypothetical protein